MSKANMDASGRKSWLQVVMLLGVTYLVIGLTSASLANSAVSEIRTMWRLAAFLASAVVFAAHIGYEQFRLHNAPRTAALHCSMAVALGAFALAVAANIHAQTVVSSHQARLAIALVAWPALCGLPAFVVALVAAAGLRWTRRSLS